jgi:hydrogenase nickel incorporation protein HypA/HybF
VHEWSIVEALIREAERQLAAHGASRVRRLYVRVGALAGVEIPLLESAYEIFRERSCCAGASLEVEAVPARWHCPRCERDLAPGGRLRCERCGGPLQLASGDEIVLARLELEMEASPARSGALAEEAP